jgi:hypothetical protein
MQFCTALHMMGTLAPRAMVGKERSMLGDEEIPMWTWFCSATVAVFVCCSDFHEAPWRLFTAMLP